jgi:hypothetical protein
MNSEEFRALKIPKETILFAPIEAEQVAKTAGLKIEEGAGEPEMLSEHLSDTVLSRLIVSGAFTFILIGAEVTDLRPFARDYSQVKLADSDNVDCYMGLIKTNHIAEWLHRCGGEPDIQRSHNGEQPLLFSANKETDSPSSKEVDSLQQAKMPKADNAVRAAHPEYRKRAKPM